MNAAEHTGSETVACQHRERAVALLLDLDRWLCGGNPPPEEWCAAFVRGLTSGDVDEATVRLTAAEVGTTDQPLAAACAHQPMTSTPDPV